ncbi:T9SS type A sorting domain-containing protein [Jejuia pallidilutea]|nr:T9SS type A sorting domain-containing protein [Jejuia pallidilutea]
MKKITLLVALLTFSLGFSQVEIALNGGFETGDFTDWTESGGAIVTTNPSEGTYCAQLNNITPASASLLKNANVGIGTVSAGQEVTITFDARGTLVDGGVAFAEFFSELSGGGVSASGILGGGPLNLDPDPNTWKSFSFTTTTGPDVSGGVTLQLTATTGGAPTSVANMFYDNISIQLIEASPSARVQVIHNSADAAASEVDVYLDGVLTLDNFAFRTASAFIDVPAETPISVAVAPSTSTSVADAIATFPYTLTDGETYVLVADGIVSPIGYSPDASTAAGFDIKVYPLGRETAGTSGNTDLLVHHGSTDAPTVDVNEVSGPSVLVNDISYGEFDPNGYLELPTADYTINISTADGVTVVASYDAPLATLGLNNAAAVVVASGFLDPTVNSNGPAFGLWVALPSGGALVALPPAGSTPTEPTVSAPSPTLPESEVLSVYSDTYTTNTVSGFVFQDFINGGGISSQVDIESDGNTTGKIENLAFYGPRFDAIDLSVESSPGVPMYDYVHFDYYATTSTELRFYIIDGDLGACCGDAREPRYVINASGGDELLEQGVWKSVFIPLSQHINFSGLAGLTWNGNPVTQLKFEGNGDFYFDNIYFSKNISLSNNDFNKTTFSAYPNPTQNSWTIKGANAKIESINVFDILGKVVLKLSPNTSEARIDGSTLKAGIYFAQIKTLSGIDSVKLIKQ